MKEKIKYIKKLKPYIKQEYKENSQEVMDRIKERYEEIVEENFEREEMYIHTHEKIYPGIATFQTLLEYGKTREEAEEFVYNYSISRSRKIAKRLKIILKIPYLYKLSNKWIKIIVKMVYRERLGFYIKWYDTPRNELRFDVLECPYNEICRHYNCGEIVKSYCDFGEVCLSNMHKKVLWLRSRTLGHGVDCCDFRVVICKKV